MFFNIQHPSCRVTEKLLSLDEGSGKHSFVRGEATERRLREKTDVGSHLSSYPDEEPTTPEGTMIISRIEGVWEYSQQLGCALSKGARSARKF